MIKDFLIAVAGPSGAQALLKATERIPGLESVIVPRALVAWLNLVARTGFEGPIPGSPNSYCRLQKGEHGYTGAVTVGDFVHSFEDNTVLHTAASLAVSMGINSIPSDVGAEQLQRLGKSLDLLIKAKAISESMELRKARLIPANDSQALGSNYRMGHMKAVAPVISHQLPNGMYHHVLQSSSPGNQDIVYHSLSPDKNPMTPGVAQIHGIQEAGYPYQVGMSQVHPEHKGHGYGRQLYAAALQHHGTMMSDSGVSGQADKAWQHLASQPGVNVKFGAPGTGEAHVATMTKVELPGQPGQPGEPRAPTGPDPQKKAPSLGSKKFQPQIKREFRLKDQDLLSKCEVCGHHLFNGNRFTSCFCLKALAKSACLSQTPGGKYLEFGAGVDDDSVKTILDIMRGQS